VEAAKTRGLYQFKVVLRGISPQVLRRIQVWEDYTLDQLHRVISSPSAVGRRLRARLSSRFANGSISTCFGREELY
jgi:hypothetical protein